MIAADVLMRAGAYAGAIATILGLVVMVGKWVVKQLSKAVRDNIQESLTPKIDRVVENTTELKRNGGSSVADAIARIEAAQRQIIDAQARQAEQLRRHQEAQEDLRAVLIEHLADHRKL